MRILILGGTQFIGRHIVEAMLAVGHDVAILTRGLTCDELPASIERLRGDRDAGPEGLRALKGRSWDACFDVCGYTPRQVRPSTELLRNQVGRYVYISAVRVYGDPTDRPVRETHPLVPPASEDVTEIDDDTYGPLKVACENIVREVYGGFATILRPQVVVGPHDLSGRYTYWLNRASLPGPMLAPGDGTDHMQVIDARDIGRFAVRVVEDGLSGDFNLAGPRITWAEFMNLLDVKDPVWVSAEILQSANLSFGELPLYRPENGRLASLMDISSEKAQSAGLTLTDPTTTILDTRKWSLGRELPGGMSEEKEQELLVAARTI